MTKKYITALTTLTLGALVSATVLAGEITDRVRSSGQVRFAYLPAATPFTSANASGAVEGYGAALCDLVAAELKKQVGVSELKVSWVPVTIETAAGAISGGQADLLCTPSNA